MPLHLPLWCIFFALGAGVLAPEIQEFLVSHRYATKFRIFALEPDLKAQKGLRRFFTERGLAKQAVVIPFGAWVTNTSLSQMTVRADAGGSGLCANRGPSDIVCGGFAEVYQPSDATRQLLEQEVVPVLNFPSLLQRFCRHTVVAWMDIEGAEYALLRVLLREGLLQRCVHELRVVWHDIRGKFPTEKQLLEAELIQTFGPRYSGVERHWTDVVAALNERSL